ncbi:MAG: methyltransferase domain-containing protein [Hyphomicrobiales bacterium]|nr:methyltransferase domain-containing protein [Hyphomicrobiales bacterium]
MAHEPASFSSDEPAGLAARRLAADLLDGVLHRHRPLDEQLDDRNKALTELPERDRALTRAIATTALRRLGSLREILRGYLARGLPVDAPRIETVLLVGSVQILCLDVPDHAAVDLAVRMAQADHRGRRYAGLVNAVLRRVTRDGRARLASLADRCLDTPDGLLTRWTRTYGAETARAIAHANGREPALDLTVRNGDADHWAGTLGGRVLWPGSVRALVHGPVSQLPGYDDGAWWVQDAAASLPARLLGDVRGARVADLCAAPGGKTAQLAAAGAEVVAVDRSPARLERLRRNLARLELSAETVAADATQWRSDPFDAVLIDAPCSATGTIRRHPDISWLKRNEDILALADLQRRLIAHAVALLKPGGSLVYCTCSLEPEEGEAIVRDLLASGSNNLRRQPIMAAEVHGHAEWLTVDGDLRTLPSHLVDPDPRMSGLDGFFAARLQKL